MSTDMNASEYHGPGLRVKGNPTRELANRLVWKEFRELLPSVIVLLATAFFCFFVAGLVSKQSHGAIFSGLRICLHVSWLAFAAIVGITQFAAESDQGTIGRLQCLPVQPRVIGWGKLLPGLIVTLIGTVLVRILFSVALRAAGAQFDSSELMLPLVVGIAGALAAYCLCTWIAVAVGSLASALFISTAILVSALSAFHFHENASLGWVVDYPFAPTVLMLFVSLAGIAGTLAGVQSWVENRPWLAEAFSKRAIRKHTETTQQSAINLASNDPTRINRAKFWPSYGRIAWLSWRQSRLALVIVTVLSLISVVVSFGMILVAQDFDLWGLDSFNKILFWVTMAVICCPVVLTGASACLFWPDHQRGNMRFFQQQRETPNAFWLGKLTPWLAATILVLVIFYSAATIVFPRDWSYAGNEARLLFPYILLIPLVWMLIAFASGQLSSIFIPNPLLSGIAAIVLAALGFAWLSYLVSVRESYLWFATPMVATLFAASWWRCRDWLAGRNRWFHYAAPLALCASVGAITAAALIHHRANEVPDTPSDYVSLLQTALPDVPVPTEHKETADLYRDAAKMINGEVTKINREIAKMMNDEAAKIPDDEQAKRIRDVAAKIIKDGGWGYSIGSRLTHSSGRTIAFEKKYEGAIEKIIEASKRTYCDSILDFQPIANDNTLSSSKRDAARRSKNGETVVDLQYVIECRFVNSIDRGELDVALEALFAWDRMNQRLGWADTLTRLFYRRMIEWADLPSQTPEQIRNAIKEIEGDYVSQEVSTPEARLLSNQLWQRHVFRHRRLEGQLFQTQQRMLNPQENYLTPFFWDAIQKRRIAKAEEAEILAINLDMIPYRNDAPFLNQAPSKRMLALDQHNGWSPKFPIQGFDKPYRALPVQDQQRYTMLRLALVAYGLEHGEYPQRLDQLADYFKFGIPHRVSDGQPFAWFPDGFNEAVYTHCHGNEFVDLVTDKPNVPILLPNAAAGIQHRIEKSQAVELTQIQGVTEAKVVDEDSETTIRGTVFELDWTGRSLQHATLPKLK